MCLFLYKERFKITQSIMTQREQAKQYLAKIQTGLVNMRKILNARFLSGNFIQTNHSDVRANIYDFTVLVKSTTKDKIEINRLVRENIQVFIHEYVSRKLTSLENLCKDPHVFVLTLKEVWAHYQVFIFQHFFACERLNQFFTNFCKMGNYKDYEYKCTHSKGSEEIVSIPVMGVNELKKYFEQIRLIERFKSVFNQFLLYEREGINFPMEEIRECIHILESCYFDIDAYAILEDSKPRIIKREFKRENIPAFRRSKDGQFFSTHLLDPTLDNLAKFYDKFVDQKVMSMNETHQICKIIQIIAEEEKRAKYYIHSYDNCAKYIQVLNEHLIGREMEIRIRKEDGLKKYLELYEVGKENFEKEIINFWQIYSRVLDKSLPFIREIFSNYLQMEAEKIVDKIMKPPDFITELIRINGKCIKIVEFCNNNLELQNDRIVKIRGILSNELTQRGKKQANIGVGAKNLASFINYKFKTSYSKGCLEAMGESYKQLVNLFKILQEKTLFIDDEKKLMAARLLESIEFQKDLETCQIITMEKSFIEQIQKECGVCEVKQLAECLKDIKKSVEINQKLKNKLDSKKIIPFKQIIIKNANYWPENSTYNIENPPYLLQQSFNIISDYFKRANTNIQFEFNSGVSLFKGEFDNNKKQYFQFKNIYMMVLLFIDEEKRMLYGNLKRKIQAVGCNKQKDTIELARVVLELLYAGLLVSSTKSIEPGTPNIRKIFETDEFEINRKYDFIEEEKRKKGAKGPAPKPIVVLKSNILTLSVELKKEFNEEIKIFEAASDRKNIEAERKFKIECIIVKTLMHAHSNYMNCSFEQLFKVTQQRKFKEFRIEKHFLKEVLEELVNKKYCERVDGQINVFRYIV